MRNKPLEMRKIRKPVRVFNGEQYQVYDRYSYLKTKKEVTQIKRKLSAKGHRIVVVPTGEKFIVYVSIEIFPPKKVKKQIGEKNRTEDFFNSLPVWYKNRISKKYKIAGKMP